MNSKAGAAQDAKRVEHAIGGVLFGLNSVALSRGRAAGRLGLGLGQGPHDSRGAIEHGIE